MIRRSDDSLYRVSLCGLNNCPPLIIRYWASSSLFYLSFFLSFFLPLGAALLALHDPQGQGNKFIKNMGRQASSRRTAST